jgi:hypothetical protein
MTLFPRLCLLLALASATLGCQVTPKASGPEDVTANAVAGDAIEVTALDAPATAATTPAGLPTTPAQGAAPPPPPVTAVAEPAPVPAAGGTVTEAAAPEPEVVPEVVPEPPPKSELQIACERKRGRWVGTGIGGGLMICQFTTRDGGKSCTRESQCESLCLARSGTCAPVKPLLGCQEILQNDGSRATQCLE